MRKCCCCIPVLGGAITLGIIGLLLALLELVPIIPFLLDLEGFNPIKDNLKTVEYSVEKTLAQQNWTKEEIEEMMGVGKEYLWLCLLIEACIAGLYILISLLLVVGVGCKKRGLMLPYMIIQMIFIILFGVTGIGATIGLFFIQITMGLVCLAVVAVVFFLIVYFWVAVQKAYIELGNRDYMYSPTPVKPIYNPMGDGYYPTAPQHFQMDGAK